MVFAPDNSSCCDPQCPDPLQRLLKPDKDHLTGTAALHHCIRDHHTSIFKVEEMFPRLRAYTGNRLIQFSRW